MKEKGLTKQEVEIKLKQYGFNEIEDYSKIEPLKILLRQIRSNFLIYILTFAMLISFWVDKSATAYTILFIILVVIAVGFIQEYKAEKAINALKNMLVPVAVVIRDGKEQEINTKDIVPGDILILRNGEKVPADCILLEEHELRVNESMLTGESKEIRKFKGNEKKYKDENLVFMGTYIVNGRCTAKVIHTGMNTEFGKIAGLISGTEKELPLQNKVNKIVKIVVTIAILIAFVTGLIILSRSSVIDKELIITILMLVIALCVSGFPESFPVVLITTLASGARKMAKNNVIVNRMSIIETLGETTVICSDKTGTITKGEMTAKRIFANGSFFEITGTGYEAKGEFLSDNKIVDVNKDSALKLLISSGILCNDAIIEREGNDLHFKTIGSPTESAILILGAKAGFFKEDFNFKRIAELPFNSDKKTMSVLCRVNKDNFVYAKGAPECIIEKCKFIQKDNSIVQLTAKEKEEIVKFNNLMTLESLRTIAFAYKKLDNPDNEELEENLVFIGLVGMEDPAREEVKEALSDCKAAGIKVKMITGDNQATARAIASQIGLEGQLMEGLELDNLTDDELAKIINSIAIFSRVKPEHKLRIVNALKSNGEIVTMTGDGVNDAPALKEAHIGIAMGKNGTDVSRSVADLTLKDDNFQAIVSAIREGRTVFKNIRKFTTYQLSCSFAELGILLMGVVLAPFFGWEIPLLLAIQILFMNLVTADLPAIGLGLNSVSRDSMLDAPRKKSEILNKNMILLIAFTGFLLVLLVLLSYFISFNIMGKTHEYSRTIALLSLIGLEIVAAFNFRSFRKGILQRSLMVNPYIFYASIVSLILTMIIIYTPLNRIFETMPLMIDGFIMAIATSLIFVIIFDFLKYLNNKKGFLDLEHI